MKGHNIRIVQHFILIFAAVIAVVTDKSMTSGSNRLALASPAVKRSVQDRIFDRDDGGGLSFEEDKPRVDQFARNLISVPEGKRLRHSVWGIDRPAA